MRNLLHTIRGKLFLHVVLEHFTDVLNYANEFRACALLIVYNDLDKLI